MASLDISILIFLAFWSIRGFIKGFSSEIISLIVWIIAIYATLNFFYIPLNYIEIYIQSPNISMVLTYILIFIFTFMVSTISGFFISKFVNILGYYSFDKSLGFLFGTIKGLAFILLMTFFIMNTNLSDHNLVQDSEFIPYFNDFLGNYLNSHDSLFDSLRLNI